jgi:hypothetical protein
MTLPNRVDPFGTLLAVPERGTLLGNRGGRFHDACSQTVRGRPYASRQWICCRLSFKGRRRNVWGNGYTELFFSDECAALAAGHRPCFECRREDAVAFATAWGRASGMPPLRAPVMDEILHRERLAGHAKRLHRLPATTLPSGTMIVNGKRPWLIWGDEIHLWTFAGYTLRQPLHRGETLAVLTPPSIVACLKMGYQPWGGLAPKLAVAPP